MKKLVNLSFIKKLDDNLKTNSGLIQVIIGARQVGKTTTVCHYLENHHKNKFLYKSADQVFNSDASWLIEQWQEAENQKKILVIDEIQKCENWSEVIKKLWDESRREKRHPLKCILLGSSSLEIQKGLNESLTGRFQLIPAHHWNFQESKQGYGLGFEDFLKFGGYPGSYQFIGQAEWVNYVKNSIVSTVIEKDILQFQNVKSPSLFKQAFEIIISYPAQEISFTKLLGQIQDRGNVELVKYYLSLYEGAFFIKILEKYSEKKIKTKSSSPKILPLAPCLYYLTVLDTFKSDEAGRVFEALVGAQLIRTGNDLFYWREGNYEIDFVLKSGRKIYAIEVKSGRKKNLKGLQKFAELYPKSKLVVISRENYEKFEINPMEFLDT